MSPAPAATRVVVTGATSGLGRGIAVQLGRRGWRVAITGRRAQELQETARLVREAGGEALELPGSVGELAQVQSHYAAIKRAWGGLDWAILNAGVGDSMDARNFTAENYRWTYETNVFGVANWIEVALPDMLAQKSGVIAGIASLAGFRGLPRSGAYSSSKAALIKMLESTRVDLRGTGVDVVTVCPGFIKSEMTDRNPPGSMPFLMETEDGVGAILAAIDARKRVAAFPFPLAFLTRFVLPHIPGFLYEPFAARLGHKRVKRPSMDPARAGKA